MNRIKRVAEYVEPQYVQRMDELFMRIERNNSLIPLHLVAALLKDEIREKPTLYAPSPSGRVCETLTGNYKLVAERNQALVKAVMELVDDEPEVRGNKYKCETRARELIISHANCKLLHGQSDAAEFLAEKIAGGELIVEKRMIGLINKTPKFIACARYENSWLLDKIKDVLVPAGSVRETYLVADNSQRTVHIPEACGHGFELMESLAQLPSPCRGVGHGR